MPSEMRVLVASGLTVLAARQMVHADPRAPQITPEHGRREDARRLREQLRELDREAPLRPIVAPAPTPPPRTATIKHAGSPRLSEDLTSVGKILLVVAGISAVATAVLYAPQLGDVPTDSSSADAAAVVTLATGLSGLGFLLAGHAVRVTPAVTPQAVGLALASRF